MFDIAGKKAMIFGGAHAVSARLSPRAMPLTAAPSASLPVVREKLKAAVERIKAKAAPGVKVMYMVSDAGDEEFVKKCLEVVTGAEGLGGCDILVNAQGINKKMWSYEIDTEYFEKMLHTNITSLMLTCKYFGNWMKDHNLDGDEYVAPEAGQPNTNKGYGKIINFGSVRGIRAVANGGGGNVPYNTTKGAVEMLTKAFAADLRPNVQVNAIGPHHHLYSHDGRHPASR